MAAYLIADTLLTDPELYEQYKLKARPLAEQYGGEYIARGGELSVREADLWSPQRLVIIRFPSSEQANAFYDSVEYQQILGISQQAARRTIVVVEGL